LTHDPGMYPKRLLLADARRRGVPVLPLVVNASDAAYRIELESESGKLGIRLALGQVQRITEAEAERIAAGRPYRSLPELLHRAEPYRKRRGSGPGGSQLPLSATGSGSAESAEAAGGFAGSAVRAAQVPPSGLPDLAADERLAAELGVLGMEATRHLMAGH